MGEQKQKPFAKSEQVLKAYTDKNIMNFSPTCQVYNSVQSNFPCLCAPWTLKRQFSQTRSFSNFRASQNVHSPSNIYLTC